MQFRTHKVHGSNLILAFGLSVVSHFDDFISLFDGQFSDGCFHFGNSRVALTNELVSLVNALVISALRFFGWRGCGKSSHLRGFLALCSSETIELRVRSSVFRPPLAVEGTRLREFASPVCVSFR